MLSIVPRPGHVGSVWDYLSLQGLLIVDVIVGDPQRR